MKRFLQSVIARACCVSLVGISLIVFSQSIARWMIMVGGLLFISPGLVSLIGFFRRDSEGRGVMLYPLVAAGSILFGVILLIWPDLFKEAMIYILVGMLMLAAATQSYSLWRIHRSGVRLSGLYHLVPALELAAGLYVILAKNEAIVPGLPVIIVGSGFILYALLEFWTVYLVRKSNIGSDNTVVQREN